MKQVARSGSDDYLFSGLMKLEGVLRVRWAGEYGDKALYLDSMADDNTQKHPLCFRQL